jgi:hypothetical protein
MVPDLINVGIRRGHGRVLHLIDLIRLIGLIGWKRHVPTVGDALEVHLIFDSKSK